MREKQANDCRCTKALIEKLECKKYSNSHHGVKILLNSFCFGCLAKVISNVCNHPCAQIFQMLIQLVSLLHHFVKTYLFD